MSKPTSPSEVKIPVDDEISLTEMRPGDVASFVKYLNDRGVTDNTSRIPNPYTEKDGEGFLEIVAKSTERQGRVVNFAIRRSGELIGCCGLENFELGKSHRAEMGYWLGRPYWGHGLMTRVVNKLCDYAFREFGLVKIIAYVYERNAASIRVLEKCSFVQEGQFRRHMEKNGELLDARLYARFKPESPTAADTSPKR